MTFALTAGVVFVAALAAGLAIGAHRRRASSARLTPRQLVRYRDDC